MAKSDDFHRIYRTILGAKQVRNQKRLADAAEKKAKLQRRKNRSPTFNFFADIFSIIWFLAKVSIFLLILSFIANLFGTSIWAVGHTIIEFILYQFELLSEYRTRQQILEPEEWEDILRTLPDYPAETQEVESPQSDC